MSLTEELHTGMGSAWNMLAANLASTATVMTNDAAPSSQVELHVDYVKVVSRAAVLPFEITDAARSEVRGCEPI